MINVLVNAYAVNPYWGSEQGMGWNWVVNIARYCNVYVITEGEFRDNIEEAMLSLSVQDLSANAVVFFLFIQSLQLFLHDSSINLVTIIFIVS